MIFELRRCRGAVGDESGEARAEYMMFELRRCPQIELSGGRWPSRGESWVDPAGVAVRAEGRSPEARPEWISGEARAEYMMFELRRCRGAAGDESGEARAE